MAQDYETTVGVKVEAISQAEIESLNKLIAKIEEVVAQLRRLNVEFDKVLASAKRMGVAIDDMMKNVYTNETTELLEIGTSVVAPQASTIVSSIDKVKKSISSLANKIKNFYNKVKDVYTTIKYYIEQLVDKIERLISKLSAIFSAIKDKLFSLFDGIKSKLNVSGSSLSLRAFKNFIEAFLADETINRAISFTETLNYFSRALKDNTWESLRWQNALNNAIGTSMDTLLNAQATFKNFLSTLNNTLSEEQVTKLSQTISEMTLDYASLYNTSISEAINKYQAALAGQVRPIRSTSGYDITSQTLNETLTSLKIKKTVSELTQMERRLVIIYALTKQMGNSNAMQDYAKTIEQPAQQIKLLNNLLEELSRYIGGVFYPLLTNILPVLNGVLWTIKEITKTIATLVGYDPFSQVDTNDVVQEYFNDIEDSLANSSETIDDIKKKLAGFDELNDITPTSSDETLGDNSISQELFDKITKYDSALLDVDMKARRIRDTIMQWLGFQQEVNEQTGEIVWRFTSKSFKDIMKQLASFFNLKISKFNPYDFVKPIFSAINELTYGFQAFIDEFDASEFGYKFTQIFTELVEFVDEKAIGKLIASTINKAFDLSLSILKSSNIINLAYTFSNIINEIIKDVNVDKIVATFNTLNQNIFNGAMTMLKTIDFKLAGEKVGQLLSDTLDYIKSLDWETLSKQICDDIIDFVNEINWNKVISDTLEIIKNIVDVLTDSFATLIHEFFTQVDGEDGNGWFNLGVEIGEWVKSANISKIIDAIALAFNKIAELVSGFLSTQPIDKLQSDVEDFMSKIDWKTIVDDALTIYFDYIKAKWSILGKGALNVIQAWWSNATNKSFGSISFNINEDSISRQFGGGSSSNYGSGGSFSISKNANGGIIDRGQLFVANEAGPELIGSFGGTSMVANQEQLFSALTSAFSDMLSNASVSSGSQNINLQVDLDGKTIARNTISNINQMTKQYGYNPLLI